MEKLSSTEIRNLWIKYFKSKGHNVMESAPLVPYDDDSLWKVADTLADSAEEIADNLEALNTTSATR